MSGQVWERKRKDAFGPRDLALTVVHNNQSYAIEAAYISDGLYDVTIYKPDGTHGHAQVRGFDSERGTLALVCECIKALGGWKERMKDHEPKHR